MKKFVTIIMLSFYLIVNCSAEDEISDNNNNNENPLQTPVLNELVGDWYTLDAMYKFIVGATLEKSVLVCVGCSGGDKVLASYDTIEKIEPNLIKITRGYYNPTIYYATRFGTRNSNIIIKINNLINQTGSKSYNSSMNNYNINYEDYFYRSIGLGGLNGIEVIVTNPVTEKEYTGTTDSDGNCVVEGIAAGDYIVTVDDNSITGSSDHTIIGTVDAGQLTPVNIESYNLNAHINTKKVIGVLSGYFYNEYEFIYGDGNSYDANIFVKNTGSANVTGINYSLSTTDDVITINSSTTGILGTIQSNNTSTIPIQVSTKLFSAVGIIAQYHDARIDIELKDVYNQTWTDHVILRVYKESQVINLKAKSGYYLAGWLVLPDRVLIRIDNNNYHYTYDGLYHYTVPYRPDAESIIILAESKNGSNETTYSIGINTSVASDAAINSFTNTSIFEPNNTEVTATILTYGQQIISYLHENDIDYYKF